VQKLKLCHSHAFFKTVSRPRVQGRLLLTATTSPYFWSVEGGPVLILYLYSI